MRAIDYLELLTNKAKKYHKDALASILRNKQMHKSTGDHIAQDDIDAVLVDFINFVGMEMGVDYALYSSDLKAVVEASDSHYAIDEDEGRGRLS